MPLSQSLTTRQEKLSCFLNLVSCLWKVRKLRNPKLQCFFFFYCHSSSRIPACFLIRSSFLWDSRVYAAKRGIRSEWAMHSIMTTHSAPPQSRNIRSTDFPFVLTKPSSTASFTTHQGSFPQNSTQIYERVRPAKVRTAMLLCLLCNCYLVLAQTPKQFVEMFPHIHTALCSSVYRQQNDSDRLLSRGKLAHSSPVVQHLLSSWGYLHCCLRVWHLTNTFGWEAVWPNMYQCHVCITATSKLEGVSISGWFHIACVVANVTNAGKQHHCCN